MRLADRHQSSNDCSQREARREFDPSTDQLAYRLLLGDALDIRVAQQCHGSRLARGQIRRCHAVNVTDKDRLRLLQLRQRPSADFY